MKLVHKLMFKQFFTKVSASLGECKKKKQFQFSNKSLSGDLSWGKNKCSKQINQFCNLILLITNVLIC